MKVISNTIEYSVPPVKCLHYVSNKKQINKNLANLRSWFERHVATVCFFHPRTHQVQTMSD